MSTATNESQASDAAKKEKSTRRPDYNPGKVFTGKNNYLEVASWDEEKSGDEGNTFLTHKSKIVVGYRDKDGSYHDQTIWLQDGQALRLAKMLQKLDDYELESQQEYRESKRKFQK